MDDPTSIPLDRFDERHVILVGGNEDGRNEFAKSHLLDRAREPCTPTALTNKPIVTTPRNASSRLLKIHKYRPRVSLFSCSDVFEVMVSL